jgi:hypothetical protein
LFVLNLFLIEFEDLFEFVHKDLVVAESDSLRLVSIVDIHEIYSFEAQVLPRLLELMLEVIWVHAMNACCNILLCDQVFIHHVLDKNGGWQTSICIIWYVAILSADK